MKIESLNTYLQGEFWYQDGLLQYADSAFDLGHVEVILNNIVGQYIEYLSPNVESKITHPDDLYKILTADIDKIKQEYNFTEEDIKSILQVKSEISEEELEVLGGGDAREYAIKQGAIRIAGTNVECYTLTPGDLINISNGLYDAYGYYLDENPEITFDIESINNRKYYTDVPYSIIEKGDPIKLLPHRSEI